MKDELLYDEISGRFFNSNKKRIEQICTEANNVFDSMLEDRGYLTLAESYDYIYEQLGLLKPQFYGLEFSEDHEPMLPYDWGWSKDNKELHHLSFKEKHPCGCPYCGRPW